MKIEVKGPIIPSSNQWLYDWFEIEATSPKKVNDLIKNCKEGEDIEVEINSGGGSVFAGSEIYTALKSYAGKVVVKIVGLAASAASVVAMAGDNVYMSPTSQMMIHNSATSAEGDYRDMEHTAEVLKNINSTIAQAYRIKTKISEADLLAMMDHETWLTPQQALEKGFIDEILFQEEFKAVASVNNFVFPDVVVSKLRNQLKKASEEPQNEPKNLESEKAKEKEIEIALNLI